jgi:hypothetical protein
MTRKTRRNLSILVAVAGLPVMLLTLQPRVARAQYPTGGNGRLLDNNNQLGSGGSNGPGASNNHYSSNNINDSITTGNVTGLNYFHGNVATFDTNTFQGRRNTQGFISAFSGPSDRLNAIAGPVDYTQRTTGAPNYTNYYDANRYTTQPPNSLQLSQNGASLIPTPPIDPLLPNTDNRLTTILDPLRGNLPIQGELNVSGPVDPTGAATLYSMSPLYGVRQQDNSSNGSNGSFLLSSQTNTATGGALNRSQMTPAQIAQMREELNKTIVPADQTANPTTPANSGNSTGTSSELNGSSQITNPAISTQVPAENLNASNQANPTASTPGASNDLSTGQSLQNQAEIPANKLIPANQQSRQLKALEDKYSKITHKLNDEEAAAKFNSEERLLHANAKAGSTNQNPGQPGEGPGMRPLPGGNPNLTSNQGSPTTQSAIKPILTPPSESAADNQPYVVTSLASGIQAKGLSDLMKSAEDKMRQGKFTEAVDTYETAQAVAPNNPLVFLGRSFAELGASYYGKSDQDLTRAVGSDPAVLAGKYDLNGFLGEDRVKFVVKDLQDIAAHEKSGRPLVLLGFMAHNTGDDAGAAHYLDQAMPRGGYDSIITLMRSTWGLKSAPR